MKKIEIFFNSLKGIIKTKTMTTMNHKMTVEEVYENIIKKTFTPRVNALMNLIAENTIPLLERVDYVIALYDYIFEMLPYICFAKDRLVKIEKMYNAFMRKIPELIIQLQSRNICPDKKMECVQSLIRVQMFASSSDYNIKREYYPLSLTYYFAVQTTVTNEINDIMPSKPIANDHDHEQNPLSINQNQNHTYSKRKRIARFPHLLGATAASAYNY